MRCQIPKLHENVQVTCKDNDIHFFINDENVTVSFDKSVNYAKNILDNFDGIKNRDALYQYATKSFAKKQIDDFIDALDNEYLLVDTYQAKEKNTFVPGRYAIRHLESFYYNFLHRIIAGDDEFSALFIKGALPTHEIFGYTFEYYHVTKMCEQSVISATLHPNISSKTKALEFYLDEYGHDQIILSSLEHAGFKKMEIESSIPLSVTKMMMDSLRYWSKFDVQTFHASLFLFEGNKLQSSMYRNALHKYNLPEGFVEMHEKHEDINAEGEHYYASRDFFDDHSAISAQTLKELKVSISYLATLRGLHTQEIPKFYKDRPGVIRSMQNIKLTTQDVRGIWERYVQKNECFHASEQEPFTKTILLGLYEGLVHLLGEARDNYIPVKSSKLFRLLSYQCKGLMNQCTSTSFWEKGLRHHVSLLAQDNPLLWVTVIDTCLSIITRTSEKKLIHEVYDLFLTLKNEIESTLSGSITTKDMVMSFDILSLAFRTHVAKKDQDVDLYTLIEDDFFSYLEKITS